MPIQYEVVIVGTSPLGEKGGISSALDGYFQGMSELNISYCHINTHAGKDSKLGMLMRWFRAFSQLKKEVRRIKTANKTAVVWLHPGAWLSLFRKFSLAFWARVLGAKVFMHIHSNSYLTYLKHPLLKYYALLMVLPAHRLIALTPWWQSKLGEFTRLPVSIVPNAVNDSLLSTAKALDDLNSVHSECEEQINILAMSRLVQGKGFASAIKAMTLLPEHYHLQIAGEGELKAQLISLVNSLNLAERVHFLGWLSGDKKIQCLKNADVFCLPSNNDSFGMVYIEAMACGLPVVSLDFGPVNDIVKHKDTGVVSPSLSESDVANAISLAYEERGNLKTAGLNQVLAKYSPIVAVSQLKKAIETNCND